MGRSRFGVAAAACAAMALCSTGLAQEHNGQGGGMEMEQAMEAWAPYAEPGRHHALLEPMVGEWHAHGRFWMSPNAPAMEAEGTMTNKWILGGRWLEGHYRGEFMGTPFEGISTTGFDKQKKVYLGTWRDTMLTGMLTSQGMVDDTGKVFTFYGEHFDPMQQRVVQVKDVIKVVNNDKHVMTSYHQQLDGGMMKVMEITYTRK